MGKWKHKIFTPACPRFYVNYYNEQPTMYRTIYTIITDNLRNKSVYTWNYRTCQNSYNYRRSGDITLCDYIHTCTTTEAKKLPNVPNSYNYRRSEDITLRDYIHTCTAAEMNILPNVSQLMNLPSKRRRYRLAYLYSSTTTSNHLTCQCSTYKTYKWNEELLLHMPTYYDSVKPRIITGRTKTNNTIIPIMPQSHTNSQQGTT